MDAKKMRELSGEQLTKQETDAAEQLFRLRFQQSLGNNEGVKKLRSLKLDIARSKTIAREREIAAAGTASGKATAGKGRA